MKEITKLESASLSDLKLHTEECKKEFFPKETGNMQGQYGVVCRFRRVNSEELKKGRERLACLDYMIAKVENAGEHSNFNN